MIDENVAAWDVYLYSFDSMGFSMGVARAMCETFGVDDVPDCLMKVRFIYQEVRKLEEKAEQEKKAQGVPQIPGWAG